MKPQIKDEMIGPVKLAEIKLCKEDMDKQERTRRMRNIDLANQIAFMEYGISKYLSDHDLCEAYGITVDALRTFKESHRQEIERYKDEHKYGKFRMYKAISQAVTLREVMIQSAIDGNNEVSQRIGQALAEAEKVVPFSQMKQMAEIMKMIDDNSQQKDQNATVNINISPELRRAEEMAEELKKQTIIDVKDDPVTVIPPSVPSAGK